MKKNRKSIVFISHEIGIGGSSVSLMSLILGIKKICDDIEIQVIVPRALNGRAQAKECLESRGIICKEILYRHNYKYLGEKKKCIDYIHDIWNFFAVGILYSYIRRHKFTLVCSNSSAVDVGARAALLAGIPHAYYIRELMEEDHGLEYRNKKRMKRLLEKSTHIIFISKLVEEKFTSLYSLKSSEQFYNGFITKDYFIQNHTIFKGEKIRIVQVGKYSDGKGTMNTLTMFKNLKDKGVNNVELEFVGKGEKEYIDKIQAYILKNHLQDIVTISDFCSDMKYKLQEKDILLMNSRAEGFGRVTVEGMLAGCLVIGRNTGGTKEIIRNGINGLTFENEEEFENIMINIKERLDKYREIAEEGQRFAIREYDYTETARKFLGYCCGYDNGNGDTDGTCGN